MDFSQALHLLKAGSTLTRDGWNGARQFVYMVPANSYPAQTEAAKKEFGGGMVPYEAYFALKTVRGTVSVWTPSTGDLMAHDWYTL